MVLIVDPETEKLAHELAEAKGKPVAEIVKEAIEKSAREARLPLGRLSQTEIDDKLRRMREIADRSAARPVINPRNPHQIIEYDEWGLPK